MSQRTNTRLDSTHNNSVATAGTLSEGRRSLKATAVLDRDEYKGIKRVPSYAIDAEAEGIVDAVDRSDESLSILELGKKYMEVFADVELVIADLSGTMFEDLNEPLKPYPGVLDAFNLLRDTGTPLILVTNSWRNSKKSIVNLLKSGGFDVDMSDVFTSSDACKIHLKKNDLHRPYYLVHENVLEDFAEEYNTRRDEDVVIVGLPCTQFDYRLLSKGMNLLLKGAPMITLNMMKRDKSPDLRNVDMGPGPFVSMLTACTDSEPVTMCKPYKEFYEALCSEFGCFDYSRIVIIGDDVNEDILGGKALGMKAVLTRTGRYRVNDEKSVCPGFAPDATAENFAMAVRCVLAAHAVSQMSEEDFVIEEKSSRGCGSDASIPRSEVLTKKIQGYLNADYKSQRSESCTPVVKLPSYVW